jgi:ABC-2 type transport system ATP-binding protein
MASATSTTAPAPHGAPQAAPNAAPRDAVIVRDLVKRFGKVTAVDGISFSVPAGSFMALLGGNGAGKTTTIAMLLGLVRPTSGQITILGYDIAKNARAALARMNFQSPYADLPRRLTVKQNLTLYARLYGVRHIRDRIDELADKLDLTALLNRPLGELSAGQRTRAGLAKAFVNRPDVVLLDEPTASLDPDTADWVRGFLESYARETGATFLIASHNMYEVERLCDDVLMMRQGRVVDRGAPDDLIARYGRDTLEQVFLDIARGHREQNP